MADEVKKVDPPESLKASTGGSGKAAPKTASKSVEDRKLADDPRVQAERDRQAALAEAETEEERQQAQTDYDETIGELEAKEAEELKTKRREAAQSLVDAEDGYVVADESNQEALDDLVANGWASVTSVQTGKGGLDVERRYEVADAAYGNILRKDDQPSK